MNLPVIYRLSIAAKNPLHVARVLAEIWNGDVVALPSQLNGYAILPTEPCGTTIEVYPRGTELMPGQEQAQVVFIQSAFTPMFTATHATIAVPASEEEIKQIGLREGWRVVRCDRHSFEVIEFWVENRLLLELMPPAIARRYIHAGNVQAPNQIMAADVLDYGP